MDRRTVKLTPADGRNDGTLDPGEGYFVLQYSERRMRQLWDDGICAEPTDTRAPAPRPAQARTGPPVSPSGGWWPRWTAEPKIHSITTNFVQQGGAGAVVADVAIDVGFIPADEWQVAQDARQAGSLSDRGLIDAFLLTGRYIPLLTFLASDTTRRQVYDPNFGRGHLPPREQANSECDLSSHYFPLLLHWRPVAPENFDPNASRFIVDWEWQPREY